MKEIISRPLTDLEIELLIINAPESETRFLKQINISASMFFGSYSTEQKGILINNLPAYIGAVIYDPKTNIYNLWTVVRNNLKEQFSLFKIARKTVREWAKKYRPLYAEMFKNNEKNIRWTERLGFKRISEDNETIVFMFS